MDRTVSVIGIYAAELRWIRTLVQLLRHPDPSVPELTRQALLYMTESASRTSPERPLPGRSRSATVDFSG